MAVHTFVGPVKAVIETGGSGGAVAAVPVLVLVAVGVFVVEWIVDHLVEIACGAGALVTVIVVLAVVMHRRKAARAPRTLPAYMVTRATPQAISVPHRAIPSPVRALPAPQRAISAPVQHIHLHFHGTSAEDATKVVRSLE